MLAEAVFYGFIALNLAGGSRYEKMFAL